MARVARMLPEVLTTEEAARLLRLSAYTVRELARKGKIPARKVGKEWRFSRRRLLEWLGGQEDPPEREQKDAAPGGLATP